ncbi:MAG: glycosyltransferase family 2 protein [Oscillospiraceae bacterium]
MTLYMVIPCYNEQEVLHETARQLKEKMESLKSRNMISDKSRIVFVNDGSKDNTWSIIEELHQSDSIFRGIKLSRNKGHQNALMAGLMTVKNECDAAISLDADLQDDINAIDAMVEKFSEGCDIVYGVRSARKTDTFFKKFTAESFYKIMEKMGVEVTYNHADYRLMSKRALDALEQFKEVNLFLRGIVPMIGYKTDCVYYERKERFAGESKYPLKKMIAFAMEGITSLSIKPIGMITALGVGIFTISIIMLIYFLVRHFIGQTVEGWTSLAVSVWAIGGLQLLAIGIIGEYIGKIYLETKARPKFIIEKYLKDENDSKEEK